MHANTVSGSLPWNIGWHRFGNQKVCWLGQCAEVRLEQAGFRVSALILKPQTLLPLVS